MSRFDRLFYAAAALCMVAGLALMSCAFSDAPWLPAAALTPSAAMADESRAEIQPPDADRAPDLDLALPPVVADVAAADRTVPPAVPTPDPLLIKVSLPQPAALSGPAPAGRAGEAAPPRPASEAAPIRRTTQAPFRPHRVGRSGPRAPSVAVLPSTSHGSAAKDAGVRAFSAGSGKDPLKALFGFAHRLFTPGKPARVAAAEAVPAPAEAASAAR